MADLVIDYQALNNAATQLTNIESESDAIDKAMQIGEGTRTNISAGYIPSSSGSMSPYTLGPGNLPQAMSDFYRAWSDPFHNALDQLKQLASTFTGVAQAWFDADATQASGINSDLAQSNLGDYYSEMNQYKANPPESTSDYQQSLSDWQTSMLDIMAAGLSPAQLAYQLSALGPPPQAPQQGPPTNPGTTLTTGDVTTTVTADGAPYAADTAAPTAPTITSETTTVSVDGMTMTETTTYGAPKGYVNDQLVQDWTQNVTNADGSKDTTTAVAGLDGSISETTKNSSGQVTSTATRANWTAPWVYTSGSSSGGSGGSGSGDAASGGADMGAGGRR